MLLFIALGAMTVAALALVAVPLLRRHRAVAPRADYDVEVYRDQLRELDVDLERGVISAEERDSARLEIERRLLAAAPAEPAPEASAPDTTHLITAFAVVVALPLFAGSLYLWLGAPGAGDRPIATRERPATPTAMAMPEGGVPDVEQMVAGLAERLKAQPNDLDGWLMLGRSYSVLERFDEAVIALKHAEMLAEGDASVTAMLGEFLVFAADGVVTPEAKATFDDAVARDAGHPAARFYLALAKHQVGDARGALDDWLALLRDSDPAAPWLPVLRQRIDETAAGLGVDVAGLTSAAPTASAAPAAPTASAAPAAPTASAAPSAPPPGPTAEDIAAAAGMSADDQGEMIRGMVARLAERLEDEPDDLDGWLRLGRSYGVLGEPQKSRDAYAQAAALSPDDPDILQSYVTAIMAAQPEDATVPMEAVVVLRQLATVDAENPSALWLLGRAEAESGDMDGARGLWRRLLALLPPGGDDHATVESAIESLGNATSGG